MLDRYQAEFTPIGKISEDVETSLTVIASQGACCAGAHGWINGICTGFDILLTISCRCLDSARVDVWTYQASGGDPGVTCGSSGGWNDDKR